MANWLMVCSDAAGAAVAISSTRYQTPAGLLGTGATEVNIRINVKESYTWSSLWCRVTANAATTNACTVRSRINAGNGNMVISIAAGTTGAFAEASPSSDSLIADKLIGYSQVNADAAGTVTFTIISSILTGANPILIARGGGYTPAAGVTTYPPIAGGGGTGTTEATFAYTFRTATTLSDMHVICTANTVLAASTFYCRIAGANGNQTISIPASTTGIYDDAVNTDVVSIGQTVNNMITVGEGGTSININAINYKSTSSVLQQSNQGGNIATSNFATTYFLVLTGNPQRNLTTEANAQTLARFNFVARNLFVRFNSNGVNGASTVVTRKSGTDGNLTVSIPASTSGNYEDNTHSDSVAPTDTYNFSVALGGSSGTTYITACNVEQLPGVYKSATDVITTVDAITKSTKKAIASIITIIDSTIRSVSRFFSSAITLVESLDVVKTAAGAITKAVSDSISLVEDAVKSISSIVSDIVLVTDTRADVFRAAISDTITLVATALKKTARALSESATLAASIIKKSSKIQSSAVAIIGTISRSSKKSIADVVTVVASAVKSSSRRLSDAVAIAASSTRLARKYILSAISVVDTRLDRFTMAVADVVALVASISKVSSIYRSAAVAVVGTASKLVRATRSSTITITGSIAGIGQKYTVAISDAIAIVASAVARFFGIGEVVIYLSTESSLDITLSIEGGGVGTE